MGAARLGVAPANPMLTLNKLPTSGSRIASSPRPTLGPLASSLSTSSHSLSLRTPPASPPPSGLSAPPPSLVSLAALLPPSAVSPRPSSPLFSSPLLLFLPSLPLRSSAPSTAPEQEVAGLVGAAAHRAVEDRQLELGPARRRRRCRGRRCGRRPPRSQSRRGRRRRRTRRPGRPARVASASMPLRSITSPPRRPAPSKAPRRRSRHHPVAARRPARRRRSRRRRRRRRGRRPARRARRARRAGRRRRRRPAGCRRRCRSAGRRRRPPLAFSISERAVAPVLQRVEDAAARVPAVRPAAEVGELVAGEDRCPPGRRSSRRSRPVGREVVAVARRRRPRSSRRSPSPPGSSPTSPSTQVRPEPGFQR